MKKICKLCGEEFEAVGRQSYCKKIVIKECKVCGKSFESYCHPDSSECCGSPECIRKIKYVAKKEILGNTTRKCIRCGQSFIPLNSNQHYCNKSIEVTCEVCGKSFEAVCNNSTPHTCSKSCSDKLAYINRNKNIETRICKWCGKPFEPSHTSQIYCKDVHYQKCKICGKLFEVKLGLGSVSEIPSTCSETCRKEYVKQNCLDKYGVDSPLKVPEIQHKMRESYRLKTGYDHPMHNPDVKNTLFAKYKERTGYDHPSHNPNLHVSVKSSTLETKTENVFLNHKIKYQTQVIATNSSYSHKWDFYLPDFHMYVDCDGVYYHSYLDDPNGTSVLEDYDDIRPLSLSPDCRYFVIVESSFNSDIDRLLNILSQDSEIFDYESYVFNWCRSLQTFPYPQYSYERLKKDYKRLCEYTNEHYVPKCKLGISSIRHFHKSMYKANVKGHLSPYDAWYNDDILKKVIRNRGIYINSVDPSKVLSGFNVTKIAPKVSTFNPVLARYLTTKYLSKYNEVFDPFSGYSGRMLGVCSTGKRYIGQDINECAVNECNEIGKFHGLDAKVTVQNIETDTMHKFECLLTCPPYSDIESYSDKGSIKYCEDWITICLQTYKCIKYVFVVNDAGIYSSNIVEEISNKSHFSDSKEYIVVI